MSSRRGGNTRSGRGAKGVGAQGRSQRARLVEQRAREARRRRERTIVTVVVLGLALALVVGGVVWFVVQSQLTSASTSRKSFPVVEVQQALVPGQPVRFGNVNAARSVELFVDYHCPHCVEFEEEFGPTIQEAESKGLVKVEVYPLSFIDTGSVNAANAFACAAVAGYPRAYFNGLFANATRQWTDEQLISLVGEVGQQATPEFEQCVTGKQQQAWVDSINATGETKQILGTPAVFIGGQQLNLSGLTDAELRTQLGL